MTMTATAPDSKSATMLDKIRKILALAEDPAATPEEAEEYTRKASVLIAKYGIEAAMLAETNPGSDKVGARLVDVPAPFADDNGQLLQQVAEALRCQAVWEYVRTDKGKALRIHLHGFGADQDRVDVLWTSLLVQAERAMQYAEARRGTFSRQYESKAAWKRSFLTAFAMTVGQRLQAAESHAVAEQATAETGGRSVALVLADRHALVKRAMRQAHPNIRTRSICRSGGGGSAGREAGMRADLGAGKRGQAAIGR